MASTSMLPSSGHFDNYATCREMMFFDQWCGVGLSILVSNPLSRVRISPDFLGHYTLQCCCQNLICIVIVCN
jgi:hypothetical protein